MTTKRTTTAPKATGRAVLVTTKLRGVFFGYLRGEPRTTRSGDAIMVEVTIDRPRNVLTWSKEVKGFLGLASTGPDAGSRVGPAAEDAILYEVSGVFGCTAAATAAFEAAPWAR